mmetsp:Transcript_4170/g.5545  ORF Transcript_4170/g.5545 Transcript_4170/m.5545 type:complete len:636 (-) Transcript_4170:163-2070(-)
MGDPEDLGEGWYRYLDDEDRAYFYNTITEVTQWELPEELDLEDAEEEQHEQDVEEIDPRGEYEKASEHVEEHSNERFEHAMDNLRVEDTADYVGFQDEQVGYASGLENPVDVMKSQFAEAMAMLRTQGIFSSDGKQELEEQRDYSGHATGVIRYDSQFYQSLHALKSQGVDGPGTSSLILPNTVYSSTYSGPRITTISPIGQPRPTPSPPGILSSEIARLNANEHLDNHRRSPPIALENHRQMLHDSHDNLPFQAPTSPPITQIFLSQDEAVAQKEEVQKVASDVYFVEMSPELIPVADVVVVEEEEEKEEEAVQESPSPPSKPQEKEDEELVTSIPIKQADSSPSPTKQADSSPPPNKQATPSPPPNKQTPVTPQSKEKSSTPSKDSPPASRSASSPQTAPQLSRNTMMSLWETVTFQAVVFVWYESQGTSRTEPLFPGKNGNLQVGPILVAWEGLSMSGPSCPSNTLIPYENIVMWTLHLEETCLDLTLDGTFRVDPNNPEKRMIEWWTGSVLELRCCLSSTEATVSLGNRIKEVCMLKAKETKATDLNKSAIAAAAATLSHQVNTTTPTQRRATLTKKNVSSVPNPTKEEAQSTPAPPVDAHCQDAPANDNLGPEKEKKKKGLKGMFSFSKK